MIGLIVMVILLIIVGIIAYANAPNRPTCLLTDDDCVDPSIDCKDCWVNKELNKSTGCTSGGRN